MEKGGDLKGWDPLTTIAVLYCLGFRLDCRRENVGEAREAGGVHRGIVGPARHLRLRGIHSR